MKHIVGIIATITALLGTISCECGYNACHKTDPKKLNIHLIPHSHDDVGWMITADDYYKGSVQTIITNVVKSLQANSARKFNQIEIYFFHRWWRNQDQQTQDVVKKLVQDGQLVFSNGGWTVNDEGAAHYNDIIDQMTLGLKFLNDTFGKCGIPTVSWQIDPFGATKEMPSLYAQMGFDAHVCNRGPDHGEYIWNGSEDLKTKIFTTILHAHYSAPGGFNFENNNNALTPQNIESKSNQFIDVAKQWNRDYGNLNQVLITMGDDFQYKTAETWFDNMDKLIHEINTKHSDIDIFYSSPNCYIKAVNELNHTFSERSVDYLSYWVGYYTERPALKYQDRVTNNLLQASKQLDVIARLDPTKTKPHLDEARNQVAVMTHHDAITGTSPQHTADDYTSRLYSGYTAGKDVVQKAYSYLKVKPDSKLVLNEIFCDSLNDTECSLTEGNDKFAVTVYNPIARSVSAHIRVPVVLADYQVFDPKGQKVSAMSILPVSDAVKHLPERRSQATHELVFGAELPALGFTTYFVEKTKKIENRNIVESGTEKRAPIEMKGKSFTLQIDENTGALKSITTNGKTHKLEQQFKFYNPVGGRAGYEDSGSYQFCPDGSSKSFGAQKLVSRYTSGSVHELNQQFSDYIQQSVRTYEDEDYIEFDWTVGPLPIADRVGKEIVTSFETDLKNDKYFYTDANGRQTVKRQFDATRKGCTNNVITANWYPIYSRIFIRDESQDLQMSILNDRTQGGSSLVDGQVELMVHRRLTHKGQGGDFLIDEPGYDGKGLIVRGKHYVYFKSIAESVELHRNLTERLFLAPILSFEKYNTIKEYSDNRLTSFSAISHSLPKNVRLLTLENWKPNEVLVRFEHFYESSDNNVLSKPVEIDLENLFQTFKIVDSVETTLSAHQLLSETQRLKWNSKNFSDNGVKRVKSDLNLKVTLSPQQIRTFVLTVEYNNHKEEKCSHSWVKATQTTIPSDAYVGGYDADKSPLYICRHKVNDDLITGKADKQLGCRVSFSGKEVQFSAKEEFEVLVAKNVDWVSRHGSDPAPEEALIGGTKPGSNIYIGRCLAHNSLVIGKIDIDFYYAFGGSEYSDCSNHEILVCV